MKLKSAILLCFLAASVFSAPQTISGVSNTTYTGLRLDNASGDCLTITGSTNITIKDSSIGPCSGQGIYILGASTNVTLDNVHIFGTGANSVDVSGGSNGLIVKNSVMNCGDSCVYVVSSADPQVLNNTFYNAQGPGPRGQCVQFNQVSAVNISPKIAYNTCVNRAGSSAPEDAINLYQSTGTSTKPIIVERNKIQGGGPSTSGGGIMLGDAGGTYQIARDNILVDPGQYGIAIAGGSNHKIFGNQIYAVGQSFTNVGIYVWDVYNLGSCSGHEVSGNHVNYTNSSGLSNPGWDAGNCGTVAGMWTNNDWNSYGMTAGVPFVTEQPILTCATCKL